MQYSRQELGVWAAVSGVVAIAMVHASVAAAPGAPVVPDAAGQRKYLELSRKEHDQPVHWQPVLVMGFDDAASLQRLRVKEGRWEILKGQLQAIAGRPDENRSVLIAPCPAGPIRVEFDATLFARPDGRVCDIGIRLNADPDTGRYDRGYGLLTATYFNQATVFYKLNIPLARTEWSPVVPGWRHHVNLEWNRGHLRFFIDKRIVLDAWDRDSPLAPDPTKWIGLSTYDTRMAVDNLTVSTSVSS